MTGTDVADPVARGAPPRPGGRTRARPLPFVAASLRVARIAPFHVLRGRRVLALTLLSIAPLVILVLTRATGNEASLGLRSFVDFHVMFFVQAILPVTMLFVGAAAIGDDIDNGTVLYLRLRPVSRAAVITGRYLSACLSGAALVLPSIVLLYIGQLYDRPGAISEHLPVLAAALGASALAVLTYGAFFIFLSLLLRHAVLVGVLLTSVWELGVSWIPAPVARFTVAFHERSLLSAVTDEGRAWRQWRAMVEEAGVLVSTRTSLVGLTIATVVLLGLAAHAFRRKEYQERPGDA